MKDNSLWKGEAYTLEQTKTCQAGGTRSTNYPASTAGIVLGPKVRGVFIYT
jgi:hypothetical protein